jgi:uncharacterized protein (TIGR00369 family)
MTSAPIDDRRTRRVPLSATQLPAECALARLDVRLTEIEDRRAAAVTTVSSHHLNQRGQVQGGVYGVLADAVAGWATEAFIGGEEYVTTAIAGQFFGAASFGEVIRSEGEVVHGGRTTVVCTVRLWRERETGSTTLVAMFTCQQLVMRAADRPTRT